MSTSTTTTFSPQAAAKALGMGVYELARHLRQEAAKQLTTLASEIESGAESIEGDVDSDDFNVRVAVIWRLTKNAQACDAVWQAEYEATEEKP